MTYDDSITHAVFDAAMDALSKPRGDLMEDLGTYLVSHPNQSAVRRLLRFGGETFDEFLHSLEELHHRTRIAIPDLDIPRLQLIDNKHGRFLLRSHWRYPGFGHVVMGVLRGMADDYGALVFLEYAGSHEQYDEIVINIAEARFAEGRSFHLAGGPE